MSDAKGFVAQDTFCRAMTSGKYICVCGGGGGGVGAGGVGCVCVWGGWVGGWVGCVCGGG